MFYAAALAASVVATANAAIYPANRQLSAQLISDFKASPAALLQQFSSGGAQLISRVRDLGASDPTTVPVLIALVKDAATTRDQMRAIVAGLAQLARMAAQQDQAFANEIQSAIAGTANPDVIAAYQAATGDVTIAATGGGGTGSGGATGNAGLASGGANGGGVPAGGLRFPNSGSSTTTGSVGSAATSVSDR
ncbi:hypothetical protein [Bradyrhizobium sp. LB5.2]|uniref:hypothetical protein n=1 Tax=unclassified Bradyrhizobium TaxID=2631580 RepID=UPI003394493D